MLNGKLTTATEPDEATLALIRERFEARLGDSVSFELSVDPSLLGGFLAYIDGRVYDASARARLDSLKEFIIDF